MQRLAIFLFFCLLSITAWSSPPPWQANTTSTPEFLPVDQAFMPSVKINDQQIQAEWKIAEGYYLYQKRFSFSLKKNLNIELGQPQFKSPAILKHDDNFGDVLVFKHQANVNIPILIAEKTSKKPQTIEIEITYQGCAEAGLCYPPKTMTQSLTVDPTMVMDATIKLQDNRNSLNHHDANGLAKFLSESNVFLALGLFFILGIGLSFTPCVLPMVPILSSLIAGENKKSLNTREGFILSLSYVLGMALTFSIAGLIASLSGKHLILYLQNPWVLGLFSAVFVILALSMFGLYELQLPTFLRHRLHQHINTKHQGGHWLRVFIMGAVSALVVSPCVSAPLAGILLYIAQQGNPYIGALSLFILALGMGVPLMMIGTASAHWLPKAGAWMKHVKYFFGVLLLAVAAWLAHNAISAQAITPKISHQLPFHVITTTAELDQQFQQAKKLKQPVMLDFYADWCIACVEMEKGAFADKQVQTQLKTFYLIQADITHTADAEKLLNRFSLVGPPSILFFNQQGEPIKSASVMGLMKEEAFSRHLEQVVKQLD